MEELDFESDNYIPDDILESFAESQDHHHGGYNLPKYNEELIEYSLTGLGSIKLD